jgi:hypothetical protein
MASASGARPGTPVTEQIGGHGHAERNGLARAGLRGNQEIAASRLRFEHGGLNRGRVGIATCGKGFNSSRKRGKRHETQQVWAGPQRGRRAGEGEKRALGCRGFSTRSPIV